MSIISIDLYFINKLIPLLNQYQLYILCNMNTFYTKLNIKCFYIYVLILYIYVFIYNVFHLILNIMFINKHELSREWEKYIDTDNN